MDPSSSTAGDETIGPPVANDQAMAGLRAGMRYGERPRCRGPKRNMVRAGSVSVGGKAWARGADPLGGFPPGKRLPEAAFPHTHLPRSQTRSSLQSLSEPQVVGSR